jgi:hypothetical protein
VEEAGGDSPRERREAFTEILKRRRESWHWYVGETEVN